MVVDQSPRLKHDAAPLSPLVEARVQRANFWTLIGIYMEVVGRSFWPLFALGSILWGMSRLGVQAEAEVYLPSAYVGVLSATSLCSAALWGVWTFWKKSRWIGYPHAERSVDAALQGQPIGALRDRMAMGHGDPAAHQIWKRYREDLERRALKARVVLPNLRLARFDPYGLRLMGASVLLLGGVLGGSAPVRPAMNAPIVTGPAWELWIEPPVYTKQLGLYLNRFEADMISVPVGSEVIVRLYDERLEISQDIGEASQSDGSIIAMRSGVLAVDGPLGRDWAVEIIPDQSPHVNITGPAVFESGEMQLEFSVEDDFGIVSGRAEMTLAVDAVERRYGLQVEPESRAPLVLDLPILRNRETFDARLSDDLSTHPLAGFSVRVVLQVEDALGQIGRSAPQMMILPTKRFFEPMAKAIAEQRRDLMWSRANGARVAQVLRALNWRSEGLYRRDIHEIAMQAIIARIEADLTDTGALPGAARDAVTEMMWAFALELEEGSLEDARARLARAQERLAEAMRSGASADEIQQLMDELREAKDAYMRLLAESAEPAESAFDAPDRPDDTREVQQAEIDRLMDEIQRLMEAGQMEEAQILMEQLNQLLENLQMQQGQPGSGGSSGQGRMQDLRDKLGEQQELSDEVFRQLQDEFSGRGGDADANGEALAQRQEQLRRELDGQAEALGEMSNDNAAEAQRRIEQAQEAMRRAERALRDGYLGEAVDQQGRALEALRDGLGRLSDALGEGEGAAATTENDDEAQRLPRPDPLGRRNGGGDESGSDSIPDDQESEGTADVLREELNRRLGDPNRPEKERDYMRRLLDPF